MSEYIKTEWNTGDIITADKLNNIEDGIANISGGTKIIDLSSIEGQELSSGVFYPYAEGLTDADLIYSYILWHGSDQGSEAWPILMARPRRAGKEIAAIGLGCLRMEMKDGSLAASGRALTYFPSSKNDYSMSGFFMPILQA